MPARPRAPVLLTLDRDACRDVERALALEWLETDGVGGYASSTVLGCPTRRYHGLLVTRPPRSARRHVFLARFEEHVRHARGTVPLSVARYADRFAPEGWRALERFELAPFPAASYAVGAATVTRQVLCVEGAPTVLCRWQLHGGDETVELELRPLVPAREADALTIENAALDPTVERVSGGLRVRPYGVLPALTLSVAADAWSFDDDSVWFRGISYPADAERGYPEREDNWSPGALRVTLAPGAEVVVAATIGAPVSDPAASFRGESAARRAAAASALRAHPRAAARLELAADDFLYRADAGAGGSGRLGVDAGFPWFGEWGRDTFVSLPGLTLARGLFDECAEVLEGALEFLRDGLLPNVFGPTRERSAYDSADAALWFARAVLLFERATGERELVRARFAPALEEIARAYRAGAPLGLATDGEGLLHAGEPGLNATWMDARTASGAVTPRDGFPVEINGLWYSLIAHLEELARAGGDARAEKEWSAFRRALRRTFLERFWLGDDGYLADRWRDGVADRRVRPNMVLAAALELSPLTRAQRAGVVAKARAELLTPRGLRTLSPADPEYVPRYGGGPEARDAAYHQGTVWPWLLGSYCEAALRAHGAGKRLVRELSALLDGFAAELDRCGLSHVSEVFDGDPPHRPGGTIAQAWNTAELLRARALFAQGTS